MTKEKDLFRRSSTTYYVSSLFFPEQTRDDIFKLHSFIKTVIDFSYQDPADKKSFTQLKRAWATILKNGKAPSRKLPDDSRMALTNMQYIHSKYNFEKVWVDDFFKAVSDDFTKKSYKTMDEALGYMHGYVEVIGLMTAQILGAPKSVHEAAKLQARAMQYLNYIRSIAADNQRDRCYFAESELKKYGLPSTTVQDAYKHPAAFREFIEAQLEHYHTWQKQANKGLSSIPRSHRIALRTAIDMGDWIAATIAKNPFIVFDKRVKPSKSRVVARALVRSIHA